jgi:hypothetical protein
MKNWALRRVISGGQTGADQAGLRAAKAAGYATGGMMAKGFRTEEGPRPEFRELYGMFESRFEGYEHRTRFNIRNADGTVVFYFGRADGGTALTITGCKALSLPHQTCEWPEAGTMFHPQPSLVASWIRDYGIRVLNVAGNRESKSPGIGAAVEAYMTEVLA